MNSRSISLTWLVAPEIVCLFLFSLSCSSSASKKPPNENPQSRDENRGSDAKVGPTFLLENALLKESCRGTVKEDFTPVQESPKPIPWQFKADDQIIVSHELESDGFYSGFFGDYDIEGAEIFSGIPEDKINVNCGAKTPTLTVLATKELFIDSELTRSACTIIQGVKSTSAKATSTSRAIGNGIYLVTLTFTSGSVNDCPSLTPLYYRQASASIIFGKVQRTTALYPIVTTLE